MTIKEYRENRRNKKTVKRCFLAAAYVAGVFNFLLPECLWSLPVIYLLYALYSYPVKLPSKRDDAMVIINKAAFICLLIFAVCDILIALLPVITYAALLAEGVLYSLREDGHVTSDEKVQRYIYLCKATANAVISSVIYIISYNGNYIYTVICLTGALIILLVAGICMKEEIKSSARKYFNLGFDPLDEY